jgi:hypothetical protein
MCDAICFPVEQSDLSREFSRDGPENAHSPGGDFDERTPCYSIDFCGRSRHHSRDHRFRQRLAFMHMAPKNAMRHLRALLSALGGESPRLS